MNRKILFLCFVGIIIWPYILSAEPVGVGPPMLWNDELWKLYDNGDTTKRLELELENITTGNTRTWTVPDYDVVANGFIDWTDASANFKTTGSLTVDTDTLVVDNVNNRVGIGTTVPNAPLEVKGVKPGNVGGFQSGMFHVTGAGTAEFYNSVITGHNAYNTNTQLWYLGNTSSGNDDIAFINRQNAAMHFYTNNASRMSIDAAGNVGIGTATPNYPLQVDGGISGLEKSADPAEPAEGEYVIWMSDGTGKGDDGDVLIAGKAGGTTKWTTLFDHSAGAAW